MANFASKPQSGNLRSTGFTSSLDQFKELAKIPGEGFKELFGLGRNQAGSSSQNEEVLFDGEKARKKAQIDAQEKQNQLKVASLQQELAKIAESQKVLREELTEISQTVVSLAKSVQLETPAGIEKIPEKPGVYHKNLYTKYLEDFRKKADEARDWKMTQQVRITSKPAKGALLWLGDQKKVHEAGAMFLLQG